MKRMFSFLAAVAICATAIAQGEDNTKTGVMLANEHKIVVEARRSSMNFDEIEASYAVRVIVEERTTGNIIVRAPQSVIPYVSLSVADNTLRVTILRGAPISRSSNLLAEVYVPNNGRINKISTSSAARVVVKPAIVCQELELDATSASMIELAADVKDLSIEASGASQIVAQLTSEELDVDLSGASIVKLSGEATREADIELSGASTLRAEQLDVAILDCECSGASKAYVKGAVSTIKASGASAIEVECSALLSASALGGSSVIYSGECQVNIVSNAGASSIHKK